MFNCRIIVLLSFVLCISCSRTEDSFYAEDVPTKDVQVHELDTPGFLLDKGNLNIHIFANGNFTGEENWSFVKDISNVNHSYCHPDVEYFPKGFNGYKYWMVFTPYFGILGESAESERYENPTVVVSNDGLNWIEPKGISNPIQKAPAPYECFPYIKNKENRGFWSDVDWVFYQNQFYLYYRGNFISTKTLSSRGAKNSNNKTKLMKNEHRTIVRQRSSNGVKWNALDIAYTSSKPYSPENSLLLSPTFIHNGEKFISYEVENNTGKKNFKGPDKAYIIRRTSDDGLNFTDFKSSKIVNFNNKPWLDINKNYSHWHIQCSYVDGYYFLCLNIGDVNQNTGDAIYLAYSKDGLNFLVFPKPMVQKNAYRSCVFPMASDQENISFGAILGFKTGEFKYREFKLLKKKLDQKIEATNFHVFN